MQLCHKLQGYHAHVSKDFAMNFIGIGSKVGIHNFIVSHETISQEIKIPRSGEECFKATKFKLQNCDEFLKEEHIGIDMILGISRNCLKENYSKLLMVL